MVMSSTVGGTEEALFVLLLSLADHQSSDLSHLRILF